MAIKSNLISLKFNIRSSFNHFINNLKLSFISPERCKKIHFGCGKDYRKGWLNLDVNKVADYWIDVRNPLRLKKSSVEFIYSSHLLEHIEHHEVIFHLKECFRILKNDGVLRIAIPDFQSIVTNYKKADYLDRHRGVIPGKDFGIPDDLICYMDLVNRAFYEFGQHKTAFDYEKIYNLLRYVGFNKKDIYLTEYNYEYDLADRKDASFYVEAIKRSENCER